MDWEYIQNASGLMGKLMEKFVIENVKLLFNKWKRCKIQCRYTNFIYRDDSEVGSTRDHSNGCPSSKWCRLVKVIERKKDSQ